MGEKHPYFWFNTHIYMPWGCVSKSGTTTTVHQNAAKAPRRDQAAEEMDGQWTPHVWWSCVYLLKIKKTPWGNWPTYQTQKKHMKKKTKHANMLEFCPYNQNPISTYAQLFARSAPYLFNVCNLRLCTSYFTLTKNRTEHVFMSSTVNGLVHVQPAPAMAKPGPRACALLRRCPWKKTSLIRPYQGTRVVDIRGGDLSGGNRSP